MTNSGKRFSKPQLSRVINGDIQPKATPEVAAKTRLDLLLLKYYPSYNRSTLQKFIVAGYVKVDDKTVLKANTKISQTAKVVLDPPKKPNITDLEPETIYADENVLVLNKPVGLLSMLRSRACPESTLEDYGHLVHRLDRATSGVIILAKNPETHGFLQRQFQLRKVKKVYYAIVVGHPKLTEANINLPIARNLKRPTTFLVDASGKPAETYYRVLKTSPQHSLIELRPKTGRTHQLRVHLNHIGTPILGDPLYGPLKNPAGRLFLHAHSLEITLPGGKRQTFVAPLPKEFNDVL